MSENYESYQTESTPDKSALESEHLLYLLDQDFRRHLRDGNMVAAEKVKNRIASLGGKLSSEVEKEEAAAKVADTPKPDDTVKKW